MRRACAGLQRDLHLNAWFPHVPLALAIGLFGLFKLSPEIPRALGLQHVSGGHLVQSAVLLHTGLHGIPATVLGLFLIVMAVGLVLRSRLVWAAVLLILGIHFAVGLVNHATASTPVLVINALLLAAMLAGYRGFQRSSLAAGTLFAVSSIILVLAYAVFGSYELGAQFAPPITDLPTALYYAIETMTTVGYGDIVPKTIEAKMFAVSIIVLGVGIFAASLSAILLPMINSRVSRLLKLERKMERKNHYVITGGTALAYNTRKELLARQQHVTFIFEKAPDEVSDEKLDVVMGNPSNLDILRLAGAHRAKAVLALGDDDAANAFVILAMKDLAEQVKTVAVVNNARNMQSVKRVHPDLIISPQILGGELLAMALSGEEVNTETLLDQLLHFRT